MKNSSSQAEIFSISGHVSWDEYKIKFLASKGFNEKEIAEKIKNNEELKIDEESKCRMGVKISRGGKCLGRREIIKQKFCIFKSKVWCEK